MRWNKTKRAVGIAVFAVFFLLVAYVTMTLAALIDRPDDDGPLLTFPPNPSGGVETAPPPSFEPPENAGERVEGVYTFLVLGMDEVGLNTDVILYIRYDTNNKEVNLLQIPRDTFVRMGTRYIKINSAYAYGKMDGLISVVQDNFGLPVDDTIIIKLSGFRELVDLIDGVEITLTRDYDYDDPGQDLSIHLKAGTQTLYGKDAEGLVRYRHDYANADIGRLDVQQRFIAAFARKVIDTVSLTKLPGLISAVAKNVSTSMNYDEIFSFSQISLGVDMSDVKIFRLMGEPGYKAGLSSYGAYKEENLLMINRYFNPYKHEITAEEADIQEISRKYAELAGQPEGKSLSEID